MAFATISGTVDYAKSGGKGYTIIEAWKTRDGGDAKRRWAIWFDEASTLIVGDTVNLNGVLSGKIGEPWTDRDGQERPGVIEYTLNKVTHAKKSADVNTAADLPGTRQTEQTWHAAVTPTATEEPWAAAPAGEELPF